MEQNKVRTYILYAIGEIALVMIGILLALQVNNWNEERKLKNEELKMFSNVVENLEADLRSLGNIEEVIQENFEFQRDLYLYTKNELPPDSLKNIHYIRRSRMFNSILKSNYPDLANMINDIELKNEVIKYYQILNGLEFQNNHFNEIIENQMRTYLADKHILKYGYHFESEYDSEDMLHRERFIAELESEDFQQLMFNVTSKLRIFSFYIASTNEATEQLQQQILNYMSN